MGNWNCYYTEEEQVTCYVGKGTLILNETSDDIRHRKVKGCHERAQSL